ncbi:MAG: hypothetical protein ACFFHV_06020 [Promethearchaeota archaeon]
MSVSEVVLEDGKEKKTEQEQNKESVRFRGKDIKKAKLEKKVYHKPRVFGPILINLSIILTIIGIILLVFYM